MNKKVVRFCSKACPQRGQGGGHQGSLAHWEEVASSKRSWRWCGNTRRGWWALRRWKRPCPVKRCRNNFSKMFAPYKLNSETGKSGDMPQAFIKDKTMYGGANSVNEVMAALKDFLNLK